MDEKRYGYLDADSPLGFADAHDPTPTGWAAGWLVVMLVVAGLVIYGACR